MGNEFLKVHADHRGELFEVINVSGTQFILITRPGVTRGNHYHKAKTEAFTIISGKGVIHTRDRSTGKLESYKLNSDCPQIVAFPPNVTHSVENTGIENMVLLVQSNQVYDEGHSDTYSEKV